MIKETLNALEKNLSEKIIILTKLQTISSQQSALLADSQMDVKNFDACMDEQDILVNKLFQLDEDFDTAYKTLEEVISSDTSAYKQQIAHILELVEDVKKQIFQLTLQENAIKEKLEDYFKNERKNVRTGRRSSKAAWDYYKNMSRSNVIPPHFMDQKQ